MFWCFISPQSLYLPVFCCLFVDFQSERMVVSKTFCNFADASTLGGFDVFWGERSLRVEHYILKRRHDALFLDNRTSTIEKQFKNIAGVTATGCIIYNPVVCCEDCVSSTHTLRVSIYSNVGVSLSVYLLGLWKAWLSNRQMKAPAFLYIVNQKWIQFDLVLTD